jgi:RNA polymerase sigma factor (sigma-70 family)
MADGFLTPHDQRVLAERVHAGDRPAEEEFVRLFHPRIYALILSRTRNPDAARDLSQEALIAVLIALRTGSLRDLDKLAAFAQGTARNLANNFLRSSSLRRSREEAIPAGLAERVAAPAQMAEAEIAARDRLVAEALDGLDAADRDILLMTIVEGRKPGEIATRVGLSPEVVRQRKSRAIRKIAGYIQRLSRTSPYSHSVSGGRSNELPGS